VTKFCCSYRLST